MKKKFILTGILVLSLVFTMTVVGCGGDDNSTKENENSNGNENDNNNGSSTGENTVFDSQQLEGKWQSPSWESLFSPENGPYKALGFEYLPPANVKPDSHPNQEDLFVIYSKKSETNLGSIYVAKEYFSLKQNIFYKTYGNVPLFSCSINGDTLILTAITLGDWSNGWDIKAGEVFFTGKKVEKFDWTK